MVVQDEAGKTLARRRLPEGVDGLARFHEVVASCLGEDGEPDAAQVMVVIETDRGPWVNALAAAGYRVFPVNPSRRRGIRRRSRCRGRRMTSSTQRAWRTWAVRAAPDP